MILSRRVALNGAQLDEIDELGRIVVGAIEEQDGSEAVTTTPLARGNGQRVTDMRRNTLDVTVHFSLWIHKEDLQARAELLEKVNAWAAGANNGTLTVNYRPDRQLKVMLAQAPGGHDMRAWTNDYTITFRAYTSPFWEDAAELKAYSPIAASGAMWFPVSGNTSTFADVTVTNRSGMLLNNIRVTVAGQTMSVNVSLNAGESLVIEHLDNGKYRFLRVRKGESSVLHLVTGADDFVVQPGQNHLSFSASRAVQVTVSTRGRYL